ncbi:hypothetical protein [Rhizobium sp. CECT 9324]|uniref:hypothetical protein n=1 Tax=Rhizobium sp. CECT 9324 TaxID=2845820 RepID=UPI000DDDEBDC|nr:hypothetical protein [Rhizobium sp. CECT 9324]CAH0341221.1 hypothetical protein RHI9324_02909 [Rhizobium sp. CECT 9324]
MTVEQRTDRDEISQALRTILASQTFSRSERLRSFLKFVVEMEQLGRGHQLKGYTIGIDVFSRDEAFDPGTDPLVRVQAGKLRRLLNQFYADEGRNQQVRIRIPIGGYVPIYERAPPIRRHADDANNTPDQTTLPSMHAHALQSGVKLYVARDMPRLFFEVAPCSDRRGDIFCNAVRLWADRLWGVSLASIADTPDNLSGHSADLCFALAVKANQQDTLQISLRHLASGRTFAEEAHSCAASATILQLGTLANQYTGATLTIPGHLYQFCHANDLSSPIMQCLDATYRYALQRTDDAYRLAKSHQQRWAGLNTEHDIVTEIPKLLALAAFHG